MKFLLFYCLMAFCAFKTAFSDDLMIQLENLRFKATGKVYDISHALMDLIMDDVEVAKSNGISADECYDIADASMKKYTEASYYQINSCYTVAVQIKDIEYAKACNNQTIAAFENEANKLYPAVKECIESHTPAIPSLIE